MKIEETNTLLVLFVQFGQVHAQRFGVFCLYVTPLPPPAEPDVDGLFISYS
jgi:hypothetical protein